MTSAPNFDVGLERLEGLVDRLEQGELSLEESLSVFEDAVRLLRQLSERLQDSERRIETLLREECNEGSG